MPGRDLSPDSGVAGEGADFTVNLESVVTGGDGRLDLRPGDITVTALQPTSVSDIGDFRLRYFWQGYSLLSKEYP